MTASTATFRRTLRRTGPCRSFTLVELVVTISVIVVLAALTVTAGIALVQNSEVRRTEDVLKILDMALQEWEAQSGRKLTWGEHSDTAGFDMFDEVPHVFTASEVLYRIEKSATVKPILAQVKPDLMFRYAEGYPDSRPVWIHDTTVAPEPDVNDGNARGYYDNDDLFGRRITDMVAVLDAWGTPVRAVHPGPRYVEGLVESDQRDEDGTVRLTMDFSPYGVEEFYGSARNRRILFVSAGPDGKFGNESDQQGETDEFADDNLYSYSMEGD